MKWRTSDESLDRYNERLETGSSQEPIVFPYKSIHRFGGFARVLMPGLLVTVVGMSGGMKTGFCETITDYIRRMDAYDILWWGTEWTWERMADRAIQRYGGANLDDMMLHELYLAEERKQSKKHFGVPLTEAEIEASRKAVEFIKGWPGKSHQLEELVSDVDDLLLAQADRLTELKAQGREVRVCVWDYLQLLDLERTRDEREKMNTLMDKLQKFCAAHQVIGITASQVTKSASYAAKKDEEKLTAESGQNFRSDASKLVLTLRPIYRGGEITDQAEINVDKNNAGRTGTVRVRINPARFLWVDKVVGDKEEIPF